MKTTIACFGDSLIYGFPFGPDNSWLKTVEVENPNLQMLNYGQCGASCDEIYDNFKRMLLPEHVHHIIFLGGANDILEKRPLNIVVADINKAFLLAKERKLKFAIILPWLTCDKTFNIQMNMLRNKILEEFIDKCPVFDFQDTLGSDLTALSTKYLDGVHPLGKTYVEIGKYASPIISKWIDFKEK